MARGRIIPTGTEVAHQALLTVGVTVAVLLLLSQLPEVKAWIQRKSQGLPGVTG